jgi:hypothetical protein
LQLSAALTATAKWGPGESRVNFGSPHVLPPIPQSFVQLRNLTIRIASDPTGDLQQAVSALEQVVASLREQVGALADQIGTLAANAQEDPLALQDEITQVAAGREGPAGPQGPGWPEGPQGLTGATGPAGPTGATGLQGPAGPKGSIGATGAVGPVGPQGEGLMIGSRSHRYVTARNTSGT